MSNRFHSMIALTLIALVAVVYLVMALRFPMGYIWGTYEDVYGEWGQTFLFLAAMAFSLRIAVLESRARTFFLFLALACFYVVGEEISWGQRIFGWSSPELFKEKNLQSETNLHNFMTGPYSTQLKGALEYLIAAGLVIYGAIYPLALRLGARAALWLERRGLAAPPLCLWPAFLIAAYLELGILHFNEAEVAEILVGFALMATAVHYSFVIPRGLDPRAPGDHPTSNNAAYSLGRTYELLGERPKAYEQFARAYDLKSSRRNRKAFFRARSRGWGEDDS